MKVTRVSNESKYARKKLFSGTKNIVFPVAKRQKQRKKQKELLEHVGLLHKYDTIIKQKIKEQ